MQSTAGWKARHAKSASWWCLWRARPPPHARMPPWRFEALHMHLFLLRAKPARASLVRTLLRLRGAAFVFGFASAATLVPLPPPLPTLVPAPAARAAGGGTPNPTGMPSISASTGVMRLASAATSAESSTSCARAPLPPSGWAVAVAAAALAARDLPRGREGFVMRPTSGRGQCLRGTGNARVPDCHQHIAVCKDHPCQACVYVSPPAKTFASIK